LNIALSLYFIFVLHLGVTALALSFSLTIIVNVCILFALLAARLNGLNFRFFTIEIVKIMTTTFITSFLVYYLMKLLDGLVFDTTRTINVFLLLLTASSVYLALYLFLSWLFEVKEFAQVAQIVQKARQYRQRIVEIYTEIDR
jgi:putative peptidoglycan lipid II flippase